MKQFYENLQVKNQEFIIIKLFVPSFSIEMNNATIRVEEDRQTDTHTGNYRNHPSGTCALRVN